MLVLLRSLTLEETDAWQLRRKKSKVLGQAIKQSECKAAMAKARALQLAQVKERVVRMLTIGKISSTEASDGSDGSLDDDNDIRLAASAYMDRYNHTDNRKGKGPAWKR